MQLPSEQLRLEISQEHKVNLEQYAWSDEFKEQVFAIRLDKELEHSADTLSEIYKYGYNIGHCGLTSRYLIRTYEHSTLCYGKSKLLVGTDSSPNGEHAWLNMDEQIVDTTLMISIPIEKAEELGYYTERTIAPISARELSEYDIYEREFIKHKQHIKK